MTSTTQIDRKRALRLAGALIGLAVALGACKHTGDEVTTTASVPDDFRLRHPIAIQEADQSIVVFVGRGRGGISAPQRDDVTGMAQTWLKEGTGGISIDMPVNTPNARAAQESLREIQVTLAAAGVPARAVTVRQYRPEDPRHMAAIRLTYPKNLGDRRPLRPVARRHRVVDQQQGLFRKQALLQFRLRQPAQRGGDDRQPVGPRAAAHGNALLHRATHHVLREISQGHLDCDHLSRV